MNMEPMFDKNLLTIMFMLLLNLTAKFITNCPHLLNLLIPPILIQVLQIISYIVTILVGMVAIFKKFKHHG